MSQRLVGSFICAVKASARSPCLDGIGGREHLIPTEALLPSRGIGFLDKPAGTRPPDGRGGGANCRVQRLLEKQSVGSHFIPESSLDVGIKRHCSAHAGVVASFRGCHDACWRPGVYSNVYNTGREKHGAVAVFDVFILHKTFATTFSVAPPWISYLMAFRRVRQRRFRQGLVVPSIRYRAAPERQ